APLQHDLLVNAVEAVRPGGVVAYVTCSPHVDETDAIVRKVLTERADLELLRAPDHLDHVPDLAAGPQGEDVQFWPHLHGTDALSTDHPPPGHTPDRGNPDLSQSPELRFRAPGR